MWAWRVGRAILAAFLSSLAGEAVADTQPSAAAIENKLLEERIVVERSGVAVDTIHLVIKANNAAAAQKIGQQPIVYSDALSDIEIVSAFTAKADGRKIPVAQTAIYTQLAPGNADQATFDDAKQKVVLFPDVEAGDSIDLLFKRHDKRPELAGAFMLERGFTRLIALDNADIQIVAPKDYPLAAETHEMVFDRREDRGDVIYHWHLSQTKAVSNDTGSLSWFDRSPRLLVSSFGNYDALAAAFSSLVRPAAKVTPKIQGLADQLTKTLSDRRQKAQKLYEWVSRHIRYVAVEIGTGAITPHSAEQVLSNGYGDCKDHVVLYAALLAAEGIGSEFVLINGTNSYELPKTALIGELDHAITYLPEFHIYADTTAGVAPFGSLPFSEYGKPVVVATASGGAVRHVPVLAPGLAVVKTATTARIDDTGKLEGKSVITASGPFSILLRQLGLGIEAVGGAEAAQELLRRANVQGTGAFNVTAPDVLSPSYSLSSTWSFGPFAEIPLGRRFAMPEGIPILGIPGDLLVGSLIAQTPGGDDEIACYSGRQEEEIDLAAPANAHFQESPPDASLHTAHIAFETRWTLHGNTLHLHRAFESRIDTALCSGPLRAEAVAALQAIRQTYLLGAAIAPNAGKPVAMNAPGERATVALETHALGRSAFQPDHPETMALLARTPIALLAPASDTSHGTTGPYGPMIPAVASFERRHDFAGPAQALSNEIGGAGELAAADEQRGILLIKHGHFDEATAAFSQAIGRSGNSAEQSRSYAERAFSYWLAHDWRPALRDYARAAQTDPSNADAYLGKGRSELFAGRLDEACADFRKVLSLRQDPYAALWLLIAEARAGRDARAEIAHLTSGWTTTSWPVPLLHQYLNGDRKAAGQGDVAESDLFHGEFALLDGDRATAATLFEAAQKASGADAVAHVAAGLELASLAH